MVIHYEEALYQVYGPLPLPSVSYRCRRLVRYGTVCDRFCAGLTPLDIGQLFFLGILLFNRFQTSRHKNDHLL